jgi:hypothetical protein
MMCLPGSASPRWARPLARVEHRKSDYRQRWRAFHRQRHAPVHPFGAPDQKTSFTPSRVAIEKLDGQVVAERHNARAEFAGHELNTPWGPLGRAYFNGYALWLYLTTPFSLAMSGFNVEEIEPWQEGDDKWRGLQVTYLPTIASHSKVEEFYFGPGQRAAAA